MAGYGTTGNSRRGRGRSKMMADDGWGEWQGGYMEAKRQKLNDQFDKNANENETGLVTDIFKGVAIYVDGYTKPSSDELKRIMKQHGGQYEHYMSKTRVTHIIATSLPDSKIKKDFKHCKVVKPEWITESVKAGRLLSYVPFQLFTCQSKNQQGMAFYSAFAVTRQISTSSTLSRIASMNTEYANEMDQSNINNENEISGDKSNQNNVIGEQTDPAFQCPSIDIDDSDSSDNEFSRLMAESENFNEMARSDKRASDENKNTNSEMGTGLDVSGGNFKDLKMNVNSDSNIEKVTTQQDTEGHDIETENSEIPENDVNKQTRSPYRKGMALAGEPEFISEFYNNSRLHHLSTWKSEFKSYVNELQKQGTDFVGRETLRRLVQGRSNSLSDRGIQGVKAVGKPEKVIMHIDMDCFFVSVGLRKRPDLKGKPIAVTHSKGKGVKSQAPGSDPQYEFEQWKQRKLQRGRQKTDEVLEGEEALNDSWNVVSKSTETFHSMSEIASCSYEARKAGVKNGMFMGKAKSLCPEIVTIPYDFEGYNEVSRLLYGIVASYTHDIEAVSCDEMLVDCTDLLSDTGAEPLEFATLLRQEIYQKTKCSASAGIGSNILQAKMATRKAKPNGQYHLTLNHVLEFMKLQSVKDIPGVGWSMSHRLQSMSVSTCGDLQNLSLGALQKEFGPKTGQSLYKYCRGQDDRQIKLEQERKSVSAEINYGIRFKNENDAEKFLTELSEEVHNRLKKINMKGKTVTLKLMIRREDAPKETAKFMGHGLCNSISKSSTLPLATDDSKIIAKECLTILRNQHVKVQDLRGVGIQLQRLESSQVGTKTAKGAASILNFTVARQDMSKSTETKSGMDSTDKPKNISFQSTVTMPQVEKKSSENMLSNYLTSNTKAVTMVTAAKSLEPVNKEVILDTSKTLVEDGGSRKNSVCTEKTQSLVEDMTRRKNILITPLLPSLNFETSHTISTDTPQLPSLNFETSPTISTDTPQLPSLNFETSPTISTDTPQLPSLNFETFPAVRENIPVVPVTPESTKNQLNTPGDYFPSPSQIDTEVLQELPPDIRLQIEAEMKSRKKSRSTSLPDTNQISSTSGDRPGCSHWTNPNQTSDQISDRNAIVPLPSLSQNFLDDFQLDESCFNALPEDIQREIKSAYKTTESTAENHKSPNNKKTYVKLLSPTKNKSPGRGKKNSPTFKVPKGRPGKGRPKKLDFVSRKQPKIDKVVGGKKTTEIHVSNIITIPDEVADVIIGACPVNTSPVKTADSNKEGSEKDIHTIEQTVETSVNLCGAVTISEVRALLKEWLQTSNDPEKDDEDMMKDYLAQLVLDHNLEQVDLVIKFLNRHVKKLHSTTWVLALERILDSVQNVVKGVYDSRLEI